MKIAALALPVATVLALIAGVTASSALVETKLVYGPLLSDANNAWYACLFSAASAAADKFASAPEIAESALSACLDGEDIVREAMSNSTVDFFSVEAQIERIKGQFRDAVAWDLAHPKK
ncbi:hypothetical protein ACHMW7_08840 [Aminobacter sp. UC22_36]|uniref:hypothetical protein n=1 Tax=Aminobacter sp. UC22_36 TaxID=3374549 RepID=UPI003756DF66